MSSLAFLWPLVACVVTGASLYVTRGVLDQVVTSQGVVRLAFLPPWQAWIGFTGFAALLIIGIDHLNAPRGTTAGRRPRLGHLVLPLVGAWVLLVPYLPVVPDRVPVLQILGGPLRNVVWLVIGGQLVWVLWQARLLTARWIERWSLRQAAAAIGVCTALLSAGAASRLTGTALFPAGDEPHYLVIAQSLWRDGDLKIENNHTRGDYHEYYAPDLDPHYLTRGADGEIYSIHPVGLPVLLAPVYAAGGYYGVVAILITMAGLAATLAWWWMVGALNSTGAATFAWAAVAASAPFLLNTFTVYPEIVAGLAVMVALVLAVGGHRSRPGVGRWVAIGVACAVLPWLSTKYAPLSAVLWLVALARLPKKEPASFLRNPKVWALAAPYGLALVAWFSFFYAYWGSPWPQAPYGSLTQTTPGNLIFGGPGLLFDQEYGLLAFAPVYALAATGLVAMWRLGGDLRRQAIEIALIFGALLATVGAFGIWWGGTSAPARPIASGLLLLSLPIATAFRAAPAGSPRRAAQHLLLWVSIGVALTLTLAQDGLLINNDRDGTSALLAWWLPRWDTWTLVPSFVRRDATVALLQTSLWLGVGGAAGWLLARLRNTRPGTSALSAISVFGGALLMLALTMRWLPGHPTALRTDLRARSRLAALDAYDARALPVALVYDPLRKARASDAIPLFRLEVEPGSRTDRQPLRVIDNGRFSLPAAEYDVEVTFGDHVPAQPTPLSLQVGRAGPPLDTWMLQPRPGERWHTSLHLPVDASFVGFRGPAEMERSIGAITISPTAVIDAGARPRVPTVISSARYEGVDVYLHDELVYPEPAGFWTLGGRTLMATVAPPLGRTSPVVLTVRCGSQANRLTLSAHDWQQTLDLTPGRLMSVALPPAVGGVIALTISTENGFFPGELDPASRDRRFLGVWIEVTKEP